MGTNDIGAEPQRTSDSDWEESIAAKLFTLAQWLAGPKYGVKRVIMQILHRFEPSRPVKHPVDIPWFNKRVDQVNKLVAALAEGEKRIRYWKHKGLFEEDLLSMALKDDGVHPNSAIGYPKSLSNCIDMMLGKKLYKRISCTQILIKVISLFCSKGI